MVFSGSWTSSAGTVADSSPMNDHSVSAAAAVTAPNALPPPALNSPKLPGSMNNSPPTAIISSGTSLMTVVTTWTAPPSRTP